MWFGLVMAAGSVASFIEISSPSENTHWLAPGEQPPRARAICSCAAES